MTGPYPSLRERRALLLIDFQKDFLEPTGRMPVCPTQVAPVIAAAGRAMDEARRNGDAVLAIGNAFRPHDHLMNLLRRNASIAGSTGAQWTRELPLAEIPYLEKWAGSAFVNPALDRWLSDHGVGCVALAGLMARACITATAKDALTRGYRVELLCDAVACVSDASREHALARLSARGARLLSDVAVRA